MSTDLDHYQAKARLTARVDAPRPSGGQLLMLNWAMGLAGETGELVDHIKKHVFHGHELDREYVIKELGDILWYVANMASENQISLHEVAKTNVDKLARRYGGEFSEERSRNREARGE